MAYVRRCDNPATVVKYGTVKREDENGEERQILYMPWCFPLGQQLCRSLMPVIDTIGGQRRARWNIAIDLSLYTGPPESPQSLDTWRLAHVDFPATVAQPGPA
ncbi:hypothetical protein [Pseudosulfitobacter pseudonitzschiae]|uniref:Antirestriction protein n=1 Tax=Pseudosulfitobacter pseudonitzschiae TaxID=1402135 RepID=A0A221K562_9RHOB|nr:hypothetical protein [Pseudosulfitobacter pseudonitzschiae]ASM74148.1 antirestriction protein [Pseudosulfitobacter pseudonitzschiae]